MICPRCKSSQVIVTDSRPTDDSVKRRRKCQVCDFKWNTMEVDIQEYAKIKGGGYVYKGRYFQSG